MRWTAHLHIAGVVLSVLVEPGPSILLNQLTKEASHSLPEHRAVAMGLLLALAARSTAELTGHIPQLITFSTETMNDPSDLVTERAWLTLEATIKVGIVVWPFSPP